MKNRNKFKIKDIIYFDKYRIILTEEKEGQEVMWYYYLQNIEYGIISTQLAMSKKSTKYKDFKEIVLDAIDEDIEFYQEEYED